MATSCTYRHTSTHYPQVRSADVGTPGSTRGGDIDHAVTRCHVADAIFPAPGLSLPSCCSLIIGKGGGLSRPGRGSRSCRGAGKPAGVPRLLHHQAPSATSAWLSLTVPRPGPLGCHPQPGLWFSSQTGTKPGPQAPPHPNHLSFLLICMSLRRLD